MWYSDNLQIEHVICHYKSTNQCFTRRTFHIIQHMWHDDDNQCISQKLLWSSIHQVLFTIRIQSCDDISFWALVVSNCQQSEWTVLAKITSQVFTFCKPWIKTAIVIDMSSCILDSFIWGEKSMWSWKLLLRVLESRSFSSCTWETAQNDWRNSK